MKPFVKLNVNVVINRTVEVIIPVSEINEGSIEYGNVYRVDQVEQEALEKLLKAKGIDWDNVQDVVDYEVIEGCDHD